MTSEIANEVTRRIQTQMGAMMLQLIQLQAEKEAAETALADATNGANGQARNEDGQLFTP